MAEGQSLLKRFTTVAGQVGTILARQDIDMLSQQEIKLVGTIKRLLQDVRLDIRDWEMADSRQEMQQHAREALKRLEQTRQAILLASEHNIFSAIDIADITARFDVVETELRR